MDLLAPSLNKFHNEKGYEISRVLRRGKILSAIGTEKPASRDSISAGSWTVLVLSCA